MSGRISGTVSSKAYVEGADLRSSTMEFNKGKPGQVFGQGKSFISELQFLNRIFLADKSPLKISFNDRIFTVVLFNSQNDAEQYWVDDINRADKLPIPSSLFATALKANTLHFFVQEAESDAMRKYELTIYDKVVGPHYNKVLGSYVAPFDSRLSYGGRLVKSEDLTKFSPVESFYKHFHPLTFKPNTGLPAFQHPLDVPGDHFLFTTKECGLRSTIPDADLKKYECEINRLDSPNVFFCFPPSTRQIVPGQVGTVEYPFEQMKIDFTNLVQTNQGTKFKYPPSFTCDPDSEGRKAWVFSGPASMVLSYDRVIAAMTSDRGYAAINSEKPVDLSNVLLEMPGNGLSILHLPSNFFDASAPVIASEPTQTTTTTTTSIHEESLAAEAIAQVAVRFNAGLGHALFLRGEGIPSLSWDKGLLMKCVESDKWVVDLDCDGVDVSKVQFKVVLDDKKWENYNGNRVLTGVKNGHGVVTGTPNQEFAPKFS